MAFFLSITTLLFCWAAPLYAQDPPLSKEAPPLIQEQHGEIHIPVDVYDWKPKIRELLHQSSLGQFAYDHGVFGYLWIPTRSQWVGTRVKCKLCYQGHRPQPVWHFQGDNSPMFYPQTEKLSVERSIEETLTFNTAILDRILNKLKSIKQNIFFQVHPHYEILRTAKAASNLQVHIFAHGHHRRPKIRIEYPVTFETLQPSTHEKLSEEQQPTPVAQLQKNTVFISLNRDKEFLTNIHNSIHPHLKVSENPQEQPFLIEGPFDTWIPVLVIKAEETTNIAWIVARDSLKKRQHIQIYRIPLSILHRSFSLSQYKKLISLKFPKDLEKNLKIWLQRFSTGISVVLPDGVSIESKLDSLRGILNQNCGNYLNQSLQTKEDTF